MGENENDGADGSFSTFRAINRPSTASLSRSSKSTPGTPKPTSSDLAAGSNSDQDGHTAPLPAQYRANGARRTTPPFAQPVEDAASSHPITTTTSASSREASPAPQTGYGTRSRNRGGARPNYAEDVEMDFERPTGGEHSSTDLSSESPLDNASRQSPAPPPKKPSGTGNGWTALVSTSAIPGTSTFSANPHASVPHARKRKATQSLNAGNGTPPAPPPPGQSVSRRNASAVAAVLPLKESNLFTFDKCRSLLNKAGRLVADDGTVFSKNDHVYLVCEPPGDPYYLGRIMEFRHQETDNAATPVETIRINWVYRPRDVQRFSHDTRLVYATMHSDVCPLTSLRGKCRVMHRSEIKNLDEYRKESDSFWFNQCFDRFIHRWYEVIPVSQVINVPENVKKALDERWRFVVVESTRVKELTSAVKSCKRCSGYCATNDSVECAVCHHTYHMTCVRPPLLKKPSRGFAWACAPCSRAQERRLEARRTPVIGDAPTDADEDELLEEEEEEPGTGAATTAPSPKEVEDRPATEAEIAHAKMWPMRYLGIHCRVEDALQYDDRAIYPRASSRLGVKHQANVLPWFGHPVQLVKPVEIKRKYIKNPNGKKDTKLTKDTIAAIEADKAERAKRPKWVQDEPPGYQHRGEDRPNKDHQCTAKLLFKLPPEGVHSERGLDERPIPPDELIDAYMVRVREVAKSLGIPDYSTDFLDRAILLFHEKAFDANAAVKELKKTEIVGEWAPSRLVLRKDLREPKYTLTKDEVKRFEDGVQKYGSELRLVRLHVKTVPHADIVRFWYYWKKTARGKQIWGSYGGRKNTKKKAETEAASKLLDDIAHDNDDSAFDNDKVHRKGRKMICKYCSARRSRCWRRAPGVAPGQSVLGDGRSKEKNDRLLLALCNRCARLWRKYAIKWESQDEIAKKVSQSGGRAWKKRIDEELLKEWELAQEELDAPALDMDDFMPPAQSAPEPPKKKLKGASAYDTGTATPTALPEPVPVKKRAAPPPPPPPPKEPTPPPPPIIPAKPKMRRFPCAICATYEEPDAEHKLLTCRGCKLTVHRSCYGVASARINGPQVDKFWCDMCWNDSMQTGASSLGASSSEPASYNYKCVLCPVEITPTDLVEPPRVSHKKKTEREREKERLEKELCTQLADWYRQSQKEKGRPALPREPLKRTANNNWVHVTCAVWTEEVKFSSSKTMEKAEGIPSIPKAKWEQVCKICKTTKGACVSCKACQASFHVGCAHQAGHIFGFDVQPVKSSRRDSVSIVSLGEMRETGQAQAFIWCKEHESSIKTVVHPMQELGADSALTALELFVQRYKQADLALTGTIRKANLLDEFTKNTNGSQQMATGHRRVSTTTSVGNARGGRTSSTGVIHHADGEAAQATPQSDKPEKRCVHCRVDTSPKWWKSPSPQLLLRRPRVPEDFHVPNGIKREELGGRRPSMDLDLPVANGARSSTPPAVQPVESEAAPSIDLTVGREEAYECSKCHWKRINAPDELQKSYDELDGMGAVRDASPPRPPAPPLGWTNPLSTTLPQPPPQPPLPIPGWPPTGAFTGSHGHSPQARPNPPGVAVHHPGYPAPQPPPPPPGYQAFAGASQSLPARPPFQPPTAAAPPPLTLHHSALHGGVPNGLHSPHMAIASPTHPPPMHAFPAPRQPESPFAAPHNLGSFGHHRGSPAPPGPPTTGSGVARPTTPRDLSGTHANPPQNRVAHGASASPNVRNLIDD